MTKIISLIIKNLNRINKIIWKIIIFLSKFIKIDEVKHLENKPDDIKYRLFNVDELAITGPFVEIGILIINLILHFLLYKKIIVSLYSFNSIA